VKTADYASNQALDSIVEEWDVWPQGPRLQGEDKDKAGARESNKITE
jgi:hypothetical protein